MGGAGPARHDSSIAYLPSHPRPKRDNTASHPSAALSQSADMGGAGAGAGRGGRRWASPLTGSPSATRLALAPTWAGRGGAGRQVVEEHLEACLKAGLNIGGINCEVRGGGGVG
jgi:hypothetical protein